MISTWLYTQNVYLKKSKLNFISSSSCRSVVALAETSLYSDKDLKDKTHNMKTYFIIAFSLKQLFAQKPSLTD